MCASEDEMKAKNLFAMFSTDPVEFNLKALKAELAIALIALIRRRGWTQVVAAEQLHVTTPRMSNLFKGRLEKFSIDALLQMLVRLGYKLETDFDPSDEKQPVALRLRKAAP